MILGLGGLSIEAQVAEIRLKIVPTVELEEPAVIELWADFYETDGSHPPDSGQLSMPTEIVLKTGMGRTWENWVEGEGWWSPRIVSTGAESGAVKTIFVYPTATLTGRLLQPNGELGPEELFARFEQAAGQRSEHPVPRSKVRCDLQKGRFSCSVPAEALDLRLKAEGFVAHYLWGLELKPGEVRDLGTLKLEAGASVVGTVEAGLTGEPLEGADVSLEVEGLRRSKAGAPAERRQRLSLEATSGPRGFFQITGVPPGRYRLHAAKEKQGRSSDRSIEVFERKELSLLKPLQVFPPSSLQVSLNPALDPSGRPWRVSLQRLQGQGQGARFLRRTENEGNVWKASGLDHGEYLLRVEDREGASWAFRPLELDGQDRQEEISIDFVPIEGEVTLDGEPLAAELWFGGKHGGRRIRLTSDEEGFYTGLLPEAGEWAVDLESKEPPIRRRYRSLEVPPPSEGISELDFHIADLVLEGQIISTKGKGMQGFVLLVQPESRPDQILTDPEGTFLRRGLDEGTYYAQAFVAGGDLSSERIEIELKEDEPLAPVELEIQEGSFLEGVVVSQWGGVPGAGVMIHPADDGAGATLLPSQVQTDADGSFRLPLPKAVQSVDLVVAAPGYGLKTERITGLPKKGVEIRVFRQAGTIEIDLGEADRQEMEWEYWLEQDGVSLQFPLLTRWSRILLGTSQLEGSILELPMLEFGEYAFCRRGSDPPVCQRDFLPPYGELSFAVQ